jgi:2-methylcitrate dehydratase PrpD
MQLLDGLAEFIANVSFKNLRSETIDQTKLHIFDSLSATRVGANTEEAKANLQLLKRMNPAMETSGVPMAGFGFSAPLPSAVFLSCVATRLTEMDDIDIASCTTPGSVAVPAALCVASYTGASGDGFVEGVLAGYEVITRLGASVNGPEILYRGIWPTYLCGAIGVAAVASKILGLTVDQIKHAIAISVTLSTGISGRTKGGWSSRWLTLGCAAQNGLVAALAGGSGFAGDASVLDASFKSMYGLDLQPQILLKGLGDEFQIGKVNLKPYCSARQAVASIEAFRSLLASHAFEPEAIEEIEVMVPQQYAQMIDRGAFPEDRLTSITSIQYQLALAAFYEEDLFDSERRLLRDVEKVRTFMKKVRVTPSPHLTAIYPGKWPGRISLRVSGHKYEHEVLAPKGDTDQPMTWEDVEQKWKRAIRRSGEPRQVEELGTRVKELSGKKKADELLRV